MSVPSRSLPEWLFSSTPPLDLIALRELRMVGGLSSAREPFDAPLQARRRDWI
jgi:hypothetical protein